MSLTLFQGTTAATESTLAPLRATISTRNDAGGATIVATFKGTPTQITAYRASGLAAGYSEIEQSNESGVEMLTVVYKLGVGEAIGAGDYIDNHISQNWQIQPRDREIPWTEHPMVAAENFSTTATKLSYKYVSRAQREILAKLIQGGLMLGWTEKWNREEDKYDSTADSIQTHFTNAKDAADTSNISLSVLEKIYRRYLESVNPYFTVQDHELSRTISYNGAYTGTPSHLGINPGAVLRQRGVWATALTSFDSVSSVPSVISVAVDDIRKDNAYPDLGYNATETGTNRERGLKKFLKTEGSMDYGSDGTIFLREAWLITDDVDAEFRLGV